jgi:hypothetical protein
MSKRKINVKAKAKAHVAVEKAQAARHIAVKKDAGAKSLYFFQMTPAGNILRAYMLAMIRAQIGKLEAGKPFKLWPAANLHTHVASGRMKRQGGEVYTLTAQGVNYFNEDPRAPAKEVVEVMLNAVKTGERPAIYKYEMSPLTK